MKLYQLMEALYLKEGNAPAEVRIDTPAVAITFGHYYEDQFMLAGGVNGRISDIPAYLGGYPVKTWSLYEGKFEIII